MGASVLGKVVAQTSSARPRARHLMRKKGPARRMGTPMGRGWGRASVLLTG